MTTESANYCILVNEWVWSRSRVCLLRLEVDLGSAWSRAWTEMEMRCVKGMHRLKPVSSENNSVFKGLANGPCGGRNLGGIVCVAKLHWIPKPLCDPVWVVTCSMWAINLIMEYESH